MDFGPDRLAAQPLKTDIAINFEPIGAQQGQNTLKMRFIVRVIDSAMGPDTGALRQEMRQYLRLSRSSGLLHGIRRMDDTLSKVSAVLVINPDITMPMGRLPDTQDILIQATRLRCAYPQKKRGQNETIKTAQGTLHHPTNSPRQSIPLFRQIPLPYSFFNRNSSLLQAMAQPRLASSPLPTILSTINRVPILPYIAVADCRPVRR